jgi:outer membrane protein assembly factor BamA
MRAGGRLLRWLVWSCGAVAPLPAQPLAPGGAAPIERIEFIGNRAIADEQLRTLLQLRQAERGIPHQILRYYADQFARNRATPPGLLRQLRRVLERLEAELPVFDARVLEQDVEALRRFYTRQGFHWVQVRANWDPRERILRFFIQEGPAARIDTLLYRGLEVLPTPLHTEVERLRRLRSGMRFREAELIAELEQIRRLLQESGYPAATYQTPQVYILPERNADSIVVEFVPGARRRVVAVHFLDSADGGGAHLSERIRQYCTEIPLGQWYNVRALERTRIRFLRLGIFETVRIDTLANTDSTVELAIVARYRTPRETQLGVTVYRTLLESAPTVGVEARMSHGNVFGGAEAALLSGQVGVRDPFGALLERRPLEHEFQLALGLSLPYLVRWVGMGGQLSYGVRTLVAPLRLEALRLQVQFPVEFAPWAWLTATQLQVDIRAERPLGYREAVGTQASPALREFLRQYERLYEYTHQGTRLLPPSDVALGVLLVADHRDHPTVPRSGHAAVFSGELGGLGPIGIAQFLRVQSSVVGFAPIGERAVLAGKLRLGKIWWRNRGESYVPYERHFFAGGGNSVRGWASRALWDPYSGGVGQEGARLGLASYIGGALLVEASLEVRRRLSQVLRGGIGRLLENIVVVGFLDCGNAYDRLVPELYGKATLRHIVQNLALSAGIGLGYLTDVGPVRLDAAVRVHDPLDSAAPWIFRRPAALRRWTLHLGLGYAF